MPFRYSKTSAQRTKLKTTLKHKDLLVVTSTELDESGESALALRQHLPNVLDQILRSIRRCAELGFEIPSVPLMFAKFPTAVVGDGATVEWDPGLTDDVDLEVELAIVIGRSARRVSEATALEYVLGYTCLNDVTARDLQFSDGQFVRSKSLDTFCPLGPAVVTTDELRDPGDLAVRSYRNGEIMQDSRTSNLIFSVPYLVSFCSQAFTLEAGDIIATGTPGGIGYSREPRVCMHEGDVMSVEVEGIGRLTNPCHEVRSS